MKTAEIWLSEYAQTHRNPTNKLIHRVCVPVIFWTTFAMLWALPKPVYFSDLTGVNWATLVAIPVLYFYIRLGLRYFVAMAASILLTFASALVIQFWTLPLGLIAVTIFIIAWIGQFVGHKIEGKKPSFFTDIFFLLVGPLWIVDQITKRKSKF